MAILVRCDIFEIQSSPASRSRLINPLLKLFEATIKKEIPSPNIRRLTLDLASLSESPASEKSAAEISRPTLSQVLIHDGAAGVGPFKLNEDGFEIQMGTDHRACSLHPGIIFTNITQKEEVISEIQALGLLGPGGLPNTEKFQWKSIPQGAATTVAAALILASVPGSYLDDSKIANEANAEKLWTVTEKIIGENFTC
ncbi:hypothetical protein B0H13DRAFT_2339118 [Mycena leptocephala]|nr:hypothetical protein B0H13DRAFT_2339118 [Mycena leptocephala]